MAELLVLGSAMLKAYHKLLPNLKKIPEFKDAVQRIWTASPQNPFLKV